jgi:mono/diheme cytochrome c family protein
MWFAVVSLILLGSLVWTVYADYAREWKSWQRQFLRLKLEKAKQELAQADQTVDKKKLDELTKQHAEAGEAFARQRSEFRALQKDLAKREIEIGKARTRAQDLKQFEDSYKYYFEEYRLHQDPRAREYETKLERIRAEAETVKRELEGLEVARDAQAKKAGEYRARENELAKEIEELLKAKNLAEVKVKRLKPSLATELLNAPMLDFISPTLRIQQVVLEDLRDDYHFIQVQKVDRCTTCHLGIDQKGFEDAPQPFRTHPKPELFLSPSSPHPVEKFGCTVCHSGSGHAVSFVESAHTPRNEEQMKSWQKKYRWRPMEKWDAKMLPLDHAEASCAKCHRNVAEVPRADRLNRGRHLAETYGCFACHKIEGFENRWKVGPSLFNIQGKVKPEWITRWLANPKDFRPATRMPQIFHLSNTSAPEDRKINEAAIEGIAAYLMKNSDPVELAEPPVPGDAGRGKKLVEETGCLGCHSVDGMGTSRFGPELSGLGSKTTAAWVFTWVKDPKHFSPDTRMPNLRLTDQEASDIAAYLISLKNEAFEKTAPVRPEPAAVDGLVLENLRETMRGSEAEAELAKMTPEERLEFVGKSTISHQGCYACHDIKGFEEAKPIGTELSDHGRKDIHQLEFGLVPIEHTRHGWFFQKLKEPRIFDRGKVKAYYEKLRMPNFNFTDEEAGALVTFLLSLTREEIPLEMQRRLNLKEQAVESGRFLVSKFNCQGCHTLDGKTGEVRGFIEEAGNAPPVIDGEGAKVQQKWLHDFLRQPVTVRPWLTYRMPTFGFSDEQAKEFVEYFSYLAGEDVSYRGLELPDVSDAKLGDGKLLFEKFQCVKCHKLDKMSAMLGASFLAPDLVLSKVRLQPDWVIEWLKDPQVMQEGTMMPTFFPDGTTPLPDVLGGDVHQQIESIRDYLFRYAPEQEKPAEQPPAADSAAAPVKG